MNHWIEYKHAEKLARFAMNHSRLFVAKLSDVSYENITF